ncbi:hypothetical protein KUV85_08270 [Nocardioides panacisoli]|uniref:hypothetical protein n=1 Tax=Nocardioides panacisoli TaxID=627624 RepID=UPI001C62E085|nr:hypothetical protein [Nocardioides panacisoli]QYJ05661.1 hypothetical protein KUV85_08270 [Nocardioides panacisoli]
MTEPDEVLLNELQAMWQRRDPMPVDLPDRIVAAIAAEDLEFELLSLSAITETAVRGDEAQVLECATDELTLLVRISDEPDGSRRVDGWSEGVRQVELLTPVGRRVADVGDGGRFEFDDVPRGPVRLRLRGERKAFQTPEIEV